MKPILKVYGLPHSGTNVLYWLLTLNFETYTCSEAEFNMDYLGWKHGLPMSNEVIECVKAATNEQPLFIFTERSYDSWLEAILQRHQDTWEFPSRYKDKDVFVFNTPAGIEVYKDSLDFYTKRMDLYKQFCSNHPEISLFVDFEDLKTNQNKTVQTIEDKFKLKRCYEDIIEIRKNVSSEGTWYSRKDYF